MMESTDVRLAVQISDAYKSYGEVVVLRGLNMKVKEGTIYGLLGPSGCGKSTLLNSVVGLLNLDDGSIKSTIVNKRDIGFMPQQTALYPEMSSKETLHYYGQVCGLTREAIDGRIDELNATLELVDWHRPISTLSGGQRRRVSLAVALLHRPKILILDEPTSGIDPLLRERIWLYMRELSEISQTTVIITTHYIEEARQADTVGLMREGVLLIEDSPQNVLRVTNCERMEDAFLRLSYDQSRSFETPAECRKKRRGDDVGSHLAQTKEIVSPVRLVAELKKNLLFQLRNIKTALFIWSLPAICVIMYNYSFGAYPDAFPMGMINREVPFNGQDTCSSAERFNCSNRQSYGCAFAKRLEDHKIPLRYFDDYDERLTDLIKSGELRGYIDLPANFTRMMDTRGTLSFFTPDRYVDASQVGILLETNLILKSQMLTFLVQAFKGFLSDVYTSCGEPGERIYDYPIAFKEPIYGGSELDFREYVLPVIMCVVLFSAPLVYGVIFLLEEKLSGATARSIVSGVTIVEILLGHLVFQFISQFIQIGAMLFLAHVVFQYRLINAKLVLFLYFLETFPGVILSFFIAMVFDDQVPATFACIGLNLVFFLLSGMSWPIEGAHPFVQPLALWLPPTNLGRTVQGILYKNWGLFDAPILSSLGLLLVWCGGLSLAVVFAMKTSKQNSFRFLS